VARSRRRHGRVSDSLGLECCGHGFPVFAATIVGAAGEDYLVRAAPCVGDTAEEWKNYYNPKTHRTEFASVWAQEALCLSYDADGDTVYADPCTPGGGSSYWYQQWGSS
jgi:hypothetical protein